MAPTQYISRMRGMLGTSVGASDARVSSTQGSTSASTPHLMSSCSPREHLPQNGTLTEVTSNTCATR